MLTPFIESGKLTEARNQSRVVPFFNDIESYAGFLTVNKMVRAEDHCRQHISATDIMASRWTGMQFAVGSIYGKWSSRLPRNKAFAETYSCLDQPLPYAIY